MSGRQCGPIGCRWQLPALVEQADRDLREARLTGRKVIIRGNNGLFLGESGWVEQPEAARVFDYTADRVGEQLDQVRELYGMVWEAILIEQV